MENGAGVPNGAAGAPTETPPAALVREQDRLMPIANVIRIMRRVLPPHAKISDEAKELIQKCVSEFVSFITGEANERCHAEHRKTVTAEDVLWAMDRLGFDDYVVPLTVFLQRMRVCEAGSDGRTAVATRTPPTAQGNGVQMQMQMQRAVYAPPAVTMLPVPVAQATVASPRVLAGGHGSMLGRDGEEQNVVYGTGSSRGGYGDEESSSNGVAVPASHHGTR